MLLWTIAFLILFVALWVTLIRPWLRPKPWAAKFFTAVEPVEHLWKKSETILWARFLQLMGLVTTAAGFMGGIDYSMFHPFVPEKYQPALPLVPMALNALGSIEEVLRRDTTKPLEVVALPEKIPVEVAVAVARAEAAQGKAVEAVADAKVSGAVA